MKKISFFLLFYLFLTLSKSYAQDKLYQSRWYIKSGIGINTPISKLLIGENTDYLVSYSEHTWYWQLLSGNYFFHPHWGIEITLQGNTSSHIANRATFFKDEIENQYSTNYFVSVSSGAEFKRFSILGNIEKIYLGITYRIEKPKIIFLPKFSIGVTSLFSDWGKVILKEKGTNMIWELNYQSSDVAVDYFTVAPAFSCGFRLSRRVIANLDVIYSYFKPNIKYTEIFRNVFTEDISTRTIIYDEGIQTFTTGVGIIVAL
jgi:hypothetical protein